MVYAYKASKLLRNIMFGVEVPQSTRHAFKIDEENGKGLWEKGNGDRDQPALGI